MIKSIFIILFIQIRNDKNSFSTWIQIKFVFYNIGCKMVKTTVTTKIERHVLLIYKLFQYIIQPRPDVFRVCNTAVSAECNYHFHTPCTTYSLAQKSAIVQVQGLLVQLSFL